MSYTIERVPGFLLYDGISWCRKNKRTHVRFFRTVDGAREAILATPAMILEEIMRRQGEPQNPLLHCVNCGADADGRCYFVLSEPLCEPCYWNVLKTMHSGGNNTGPIPSAQPGTPTRGRVIMLPAVQTEQSKPAGPHEETPEEIAARLGVTLDVLQASGYFD